MSGWDVSESVCVCTCVHQGGVCTWCVEKKDPLLFVRAGPPGVLVSGCVGFTHAYRNRGAVCPLLLFMFISTRGVFSSVLSPVSLADLVIDRATD